VAPPHNAEQRAAGQLRDAPEEPLADTLAGGAVIATATASRGVKA
jgi:hypothetical protein